METFDRPPNEVWLPALRSPARPADREEPPVTYYDQPMIKPPHWKWYIPTYFWLGGIAGGAAAIGAAARLFGGPAAKRDTVRHARYLSLALAIICPIFLILDLGRPERFFRMFRVVKVSSPLSIGTWILSAFGLVSGALAVRQAAEDSVVVPRESGLGRLLRRLIPDAPLSALQGLLGLGLGGYTGVLIAVTAIPLWAAGGIFLGPLFLATALSSGAAALTLLSMAFGKRDAESERARGTVETIEAISAASQLALVSARDLTTPRRINQPLRVGFWGRVFRIGAVGGGMATPLTLRIAARLLGPRATKIISVIAAVLTLLGALAERFAIVEAGKVSSRDPLAYQDLTAGAPGEARPTPSEQALHAPQASAHRPRIAASDTALDSMR